MKTHSARMLSALVVFSLFLNVMAEDLIEDFRTPQIPLWNNSVSEGMVGRRERIDPITERLITIQNVSNLQARDARSRMVIMEGVLNVINDPGVGSRQTLQYYFSKPQDYSKVKSVKIDFLSSNVEGTVDVYVDDASPKNYRHSASIPAQHKPFSVTVRNVVREVDSSKIVSIAFVFHSREPGQNVRVRGIKTQE